VYPPPQAQLAAGGWNTAIGTYGGPGPQLVAGLGGLGGSAMRIPPRTYVQYISVTRSLNNNYSRIIGGFRFQVANLASTGGGQTSGWVFYDNSTAQCALVPQAISGRIALVQGDGTAATPAVLGNSLIGVADGTSHYLEFDITFGIGAAGGFTVWLDGVQVFSGIGTTQQSANAFCNTFGPNMNAVGYSGCTNIIDTDDLYIFSSAGSTNNAVLLTNPIVLTQFGTSDAQKQWSSNGNVIGNSYSTNAASLGISSNTMYLAAFTPIENCVLGNIAVLPQSTNATGKYKGVVYSDSGGNPNTLLSDGTAVTGLVANTQLTMPLVSPQNLVAGTQYWIGFYSDTGGNFQEFDATTKGRAGTVTYAGGAPSSPPTLTANQQSIMLFGLCTGGAANYPSEITNPSAGDASSLTSGSVGISDLYTFAALPTNVTNVYTVGVSGYTRLSYAGARTMNFNVSSSGTVSAGSAPGQVPLISYSWHDTNNDVDPHTGTTWSVSGVSASTAGMSIAS
jgi:hypothetical protein